MQFSEKWLRTLADPPLSTEQLAHLLTMSGLEVEDTKPVAQGFSGVVVGEVLGVEGHPGADRLKVCAVDAGQGAVLSIVCGAPNVAAGMKVPCALVGARLPATAGASAPLEIKPATLRGVQSQGMLCSARELGLSEDHSGLLELDPAARPGDDVRSVLALDDSLFTLKLTPNRADCLSVLGIAREVAALTGAPLHAPEIRAIPKAIDAAVPVSISDPAGCGRFTGRVIRSVNAGAATPAWMKQRLERAGQRTISALVDVTNYVMLELGRPLHVYDADKLQGGIDVRFARKGEKLKLLNEQVVELDESVLAITDGSGPIGLAGIMGGESTKAGLDTRNIFLEAAFFFPDAIAGRARRFNFTSDASHRFERGVDFDNNVAGIERATELILEICGGEAGPVVDTVARLPERKPVEMRADRARKVIGVDVATDEMASILGRLGLKAERRGAGEQAVFRVTPPSFRFDIAIEEDLIEEVTRVYGFDRIPTRSPVARAAMSGAPEGRRSLHDLRAILASAGYQEVVNYSFVDPAWEADLAGEARPLKVLNPIASQRAVMRSTLLGGLLENVRYNLNRKLDRVRVFEVGRAFLRDASARDGDLEVAGIRQPVRVAAVAYGSVAGEQWGMPATRADFHDIKKDLENLLEPRQARYEAAPHPALHPGRSARVVLDGKGIGFIGELHPRWQKKYELPLPAVLFEIDAEEALGVPLPAYRQVPRVPPVRRDLAYAFDGNIPLQAILDALNAAKSPLIEEVSVFDVYRGDKVGKGKKGLAFRVLLQDTQKTLTDAEVDAAVADLRKVLEQDFGGTLRQ